MEEQLAQAATPRRRGWGWKLRGFLILVLLLSAIPAVLTLAQLGPLAQLPPDKGELPVARLPAAKQLPAQPPAAPVLPARPIQPAGKPFDRPLPADLPPAPKLDKQPQSNILPTANDALALYLAYIQTLPEEERYFHRGIWVWTGDDDSAKAIGQTVNTPSRSPEIVQPRKLRAAGGRLIVQDVALYNYAPRLRDLEEWLDLWEEFRFDPKFSLNLTQDTLAFAEKGQFLPTEPVRCDVTREGGGKPPQVLHSKVTAKDIGKYAVLRVQPLSVDPELLAKLQCAVGSAAPLVTHNYLISRFLASIKDAKLNNGLFALIYGGLYYDFAGIPGAADQALAYQGHRRLANEASLADKNYGKNATEDQAVEDKKVAAKKAAGDAKAAKATDLDKLFQGLGVGNIKAGITARDLFNELGSDGRVACARSKVAAGRPRRIDFLPILSSHIFKSKRFISLTHDFKRSNFDRGTNVFQNLIDFANDDKEADALEVLWTSLNGTVAASLYNNKGKLQEKAPDDVVKDHTMPEPFYAELQAIISCMACHDVRGFDGWQPLVNDVKTMFAAKPGQVNLNILTDLTFRDQFDALARLKGLYKGSPDPLLRSARDDYAAAVLRATGSWKQAEPDA